VSNLLKPLNLNKVVQIGIVVRDAAQSAQRYAALFGLDVPEVIVTETEDTAKTRFHGKPTQARAKLAFFRFDNITIELIEPVDGPSTWQEFLDTRGEGVHHIAFDIKDMDEQIAQIENRQAPLIQQGRWTDGNGGRYAYLDTVPQLGIMLELLENF
jgi:catechol 2,3-dioxygenase-like lactoylglutathione lyase family enzyme